MRINKNVELGLDVISFLNKQEPTKLFTSKVLSEQLTVSQNFLNQILRKLSVAKIVRSVRGPGGGYQVTDQTTAVSAYMVATALGHSFETTTMDSTPRSQLSQAIANAYASVSV